MATEEEVEVARANAVAWLALTDDELVERSGSLGLDGSLHHDENVPGAVKATRSDVAAARAAADDNARSWAGDEFVDSWIEQNRDEDER